jgi:hypothetical protein
LKNNPRITADVDIVNSPEPLEYSPQNLTAPRGGIFVTEKSKEQIKNLDWLLKRDNRKYFKYAPSPAGQTESERTRLVKECKSPTRMRRSLEDHAKERKLNAYAVHLQQSGNQYIEAPIKTVLSDGELSSNERGVLEDFEVDKNTGEIFNVIRERKTAIANLSHRKWSDEYRIRVTTDAAPSRPPPVQAGDRLTTALTSRGAKNILDSGAYVSAVRGGFTTFLTLTFNADAREKIVSGESTIGNECSRFFDALQKMYQRGWSADKTVIAVNNKNNELFSNNNFECVANDEQIIPPATDKLDYLWVAEAPVKLKVIETRGDFDCVEQSVNPHCHVLLRWNVEPHLFRAWAARIESMWGQGFANLLRIKDDKAASGYLLKAIGYLVKGEDSNDQGEIRGNRYNISKPARALPWEHISSFHAEHMASIIGEVRAKLERKAAPTVNLIKDGYKQITRAVRQKAVFKNQGKLTATIDAKIKAIEHKIKTQKAHLRRSPVRGAEYMLTFKGRYPLKKFMEWAIGLRFWNADDAASEKSPQRLPQQLLTTMRDGVKKSFSKVRNRLIENENFWAQRLCALLPLEVDENEQVYNRMTDFYQYQQLAA